MILIVSIGVVFGAFWLWIWSSVVEEEREAQRRRELDEERDG